MNESVILRLKAADQLLQQLKRLNYSSDIIIMNHNLHIQEVLRPALFANSLLPPPSSQQWGSRLLSGVEQKATTTLW